MNPSKTEIKAIADEVVRQLLPKLASMLVPVDVSGDDEHVPLKKRLEILEQAKKTMQDFRAKQAEKRQ